MKYPAYSPYHAPVHWTVFALLFAILASVVPGSISLPSAEAQLQKGHGLPASKQPPPGQPPPPPTQKLPGHVILTPNQKLPGHAIPLLKDVKPIKPTSKAQPLDLSILLKLRNQDVLDRLLQAQNDPTSPHYHQYLTSQAFTDQFGPDMATINQVTAYLKSQHILVTSVSKNHTLIDAATTVGATEHAFGVTLNDYKLSNRVVYAPTGSPSIPNDLVNSIENITGLNNVGLYRPRNIVNSPKRQLHHAGPGGGYTPAELRAAYNVQPLLRDGEDGTGQTVALIELDGYRPSDIDTYLQQYNLGPPKYSNVLIDGASTTPGTDALEVSLDMEMVSAMAPGAKQKVYIGPNTTSGINDIYNKIVADDIAKVITISWGECELAAAASRLDVLNTIFKQGAAQGQAFFAASGDAGAYDCGDNNLAVDLPASNPYVISVGGTTLQTGSGGIYGSETAWSNANDTQSGHIHGIGGGGGKSTYYPRPDYQHGYNLTDTNRLLPDVSANADPATGYSIYCTVPSHTGWLTVGGTSAAAPLWAGIATDINQYLLRQKQPPLGNGTTALYQLYNTPQVYPPYQDITSGTNLFYAATAGYDLATGLGTPNAWNIARDLESPVGVLTELLENAGFEDGTSPWQEQSRGGYELINTTNPHTGKRSAYLCGYSNCQDTIFQTITIPSTTRRETLSYWIYIGRNDFTPNCQDNVIVSLRTEEGSPIATVQKLCSTDANGWVQYTFDVTSDLTQYVGKKIQVAFTVTGISAERNTFLVNVDDVSMDALNTAPGIATQLLENAGFEDGTSPWQEQSRGGYELISRTNPYLGQYGAYLCGYSNCQDTIFQTVTLPSTIRKAVLSYWIYIGRNDPISSCQDNFIVSLRTAQGTPIETEQKLCNTDANGWTQYTLDVTSDLAHNAGKKVQIAFTASGVSAERANFLVNVDDVALYVTHV